MAELVFTWRIHGGTVTELWPEKGGTYIQTAAIDCRYAADVTAM